jgi:hypothetical protein
MYDSFQHRQRKADPMNPHSHDYRDTVRAGEKTGSPYQAFRRRDKLSPWLVFSTVVTVAAFLFLLCALPWQGGW